MAESKQYEMEGKIKLILDTMKFESGFVKREFVITTNDLYPQDVKFEIYKDKCVVLDQFQEGDDIKVHFNIRGSCWQNRYYTNLQVCISCVANHGMQ